MTTKLQPPAGTIIETREDAIRILLSPRYVDSYYYTGYVIGEGGVTAGVDAVIQGKHLPYRVERIAEGYTEDPNFSMYTLVKMPDVEGVTSEPTPEPLKHYVWVDGKQLPTKPHNTREEAVEEALRLAEKENRLAVVCTDIIKPVTRAEIVELEKAGE